MPQPPELTLVASASQEETPETLLLNAKGLAHLLQVSERQVWRMDCTAMLPSAVTIGRLKRWSRSRIVEWIEKGCPARAKREALDS